MASECDKEQIKIPTSNQPRHGSENQKPSLKPQEAPVSQSSTPSKQDQLPGSNVKSDFLQKFALLFSNDSQHSLSSKIPIYFNTHSFLKELSPTYLANVLKWIEIYLSDEFISKNNFILRHLVRDREEYICIKLLSTFKRLKIICRDSRVIAFAAYFSNILVLNCEWTKIRRVEPIPEWIIANFYRNEGCHENENTIHPTVYVNEVVPMSTVVIYPIPDILTSSTKEAGDDSPYGIIGSILRPYYRNTISTTLIYPHKYIPTRFQEYFDRNPHNRLCIVAFVEFDDYDEATRIVSNWKPEDHIGTQVEFIDASEHCLINTSITKSLYSSNCSVFSSENSSSIRSSITSLSSNTYEVNLGEPGGSFFYDNKWPHLIDPQKNPTPNSSSSSLFPDHHSQYSKSCSEFFQHF